MTGIKANLLEVSDYVAQRTRQRVEGLTDEEYFWEPAPLCWTLRPTASGVYRGDHAVAPAQPPFTTIAWRLWHLIGCYGGDRNPKWLALDRPPTGLDHGDPAPPTAAEAIDALARAQVHWHDLLTSLPAEQYGDRLGPIAGQYAESDKADLILHQLDEQIHHAAEIGVVRDLYRATVGAPHLDADVAALLTGDRRAVDEGRAAELVATHPDLLQRAAHDGRSGAIPVLLALGFPADGAAPGDDGHRLTPLHLTAGAGDLDAVRALVAAGADLTVRDPEFKSTPLEWAEYFHQAPVVEYLREATP